MYELLSFVTRGKVRKKVLFGLEEPKTPTQLSSVIKSHRSTASRTVIELEKKGLVECLTPKEKLGRYYGLTTTGKTVLEKLKKVES